MKINSVNKDVNFGWSYQTHQRITEMLVDQLPKLKEYKPLFSKMVAMPDFDERGFKGNNHFYYTPKLFRPRESFLDFLGQNNAYVRYLKHIYEFKELLSIDREKAISHAARALHFLQDVTQPHHTERGTVLEKWRDLSVHKRFEKFELDSDDIYVKNAENSKLEHNSAGFYDIFNTAVSKSMSIPAAKSTNHNLWKEIAQDGISNAVAVSRAFLKNISDAIS